MATTLQSRAFAQIVDLISEGEIVGLVNDGKSIYLNGTVLENADGSRNFQNVTYEGRTGTQAQTYVPNAASVESAIPVALEVTAATSLVRTISNADVDSVRIILSTPSLYKAENDGKQNGTSVNIAIDVQASGGNYVEQVNDVIDGKATSRYQKAYKIALIGSAPWNVRVRRITADSTELSLQNETYWDSYTEIIEAKLRYPNSALVSMRLDAASFQGIPSRSYDMKLLKIKLPTNYDPVTRTYTGAWDGTFKTEWSDNPAWVFYDLATNSRYGLGGFIASSQIDKWTLYTVGRYCDAVNSSGAYQGISNGFGSLEPRFTCNLYLQSRQEAFKVMNDLASVFRGMTYWASGELTVSQDSPSDPVALYTQANVIDGRFVYSGASAKAKHTVALITWNDPADQYRQKIEYVEDAEQIARLGVIQTEVTAFGCTSRGQAHRVGKWLLYSERYESETVSFSTGVEGLLARPGQVIKVADSHRAGARMGGRVITATTTVIGVDATVSLGAGTWTMYVVLANGTVESRTISSTAGQSVTLASALTSAPQAQAHWIITGSTLEAQTFRVISVSEKDDGTVEVTALKHDPNKYAAVESGYTLTPRNISRLDDPPAQPENPEVTEYLYTTPTDVKVGVTITWDSVQFATTYVVQYRIGQQNLIEATTTTNSLELLDADTGNYTITVYAANILGGRSVPLTFSASVLGKTARPSDVTGLQLIAQGATGLLTWDQHPDLDVRLGGKISVKFAESADATWNTALRIGEFSGASTSGTVPIAAGTYFARAFDSTGNESLNTTTVASQTLSVTQYNAVLTQTEDPTFTGAKTDMVVELSNLKLAPIPTPSLDLNFTGGSYQSGEVYPDPLEEQGVYEFSSYVDAGAVYTSRVTISFLADSVNVANLVDRWPLIDTIGDIDLGDVSADFVDTWADWDAITNFDSELQLGEAAIAFEVATTNDNPASSPTWSSWRPYYLGDYTARAFKFRMTVERGSDDYTNVEISELSVTIDVPDRIESADNVSVGSGGLTVTFTNAFYDTPAVAITGTNLATGDFVVVTSKSSTGFTVQFKNSAGTGIARTMDWIAKGFGYKAT